MKISRRDLFKTASVASGAALGRQLLTGTAAAQNSSAAHASESLPPAFDELKPLGDRVKPISTTELQGRIAHAQQLMSDTKPRFEALYVTPGTTLLYYAGIQPLTDEYAKVRHGVTNSLAEAWVTEDVGAYVIDKNYFPNADAVKQAPNVDLLGPKPVRYQEGDRLIELRTVFLLMRN